APLLDLPRVNRVDLAERRQKLRIQVGNVKQGPPPRVSKRRGASSVGMGPTSRRLTYSIDPRACLRLPRATHGQGLPPRSIDFLGRGDPPLHCPTRPCSPCRPTQRWSPTWWAGSLRSPARHAAHRQSLRRRREPRH